MTLRHLLVLVLCALGLFPVASGCSDAAVGSSPNGGTNGEGGLCLLNNCTEDADCGSCGDGKTVCFASEKRCVACGPNAGGKTCKAGQTCTKYGYCAGSGKACGEDANGVPTISCNNNADCGACGPKFQVCDTTAKKCVGCSPSNVTNCQSTDLCDASGTCVAKCPAQCDVDAQCGACGATGKEAHACNKHTCAQCSPTKPECPDGGKCDFDHGTCVPQCGVTMGKSDCTGDTQCAGCTATTNCKEPINGGLGVCAVPANGCSDIGKGIIVLPPPADKVTQACSNDMDCAGVSTDFNIGKILKDFTGLSQIKEGTIEYTMNSCASVEVLDKSCGVCVPCKQDTDCTDIDITKISGDIFGPLGSVASKLLLDKAFGPNDQKIHMYCQHVAGDYGACLPCANPLARCGTSKDPLPTTGACDHELCDVGGPLGVQCGDGCVAAVCAKDPWCCTKSWDLACKTDVDLYCPKKTCEPDKCIYREPNKWYCHSDKKSAYHCVPNEQGELQLADGVDCADGYECETDGDGQKDPAKLCTGVEGDSNTQCTVAPSPANPAKAKCFKK